MSIWLSLTRPLIDCACARAVSIESAWRTPRTSKSAAARLPEETEVEPRDGGYFFAGPEGLPLALVPGEGEFTDYDLEGLVLRSGDHLVQGTPSEASQSMLFHLGCLVDSAEDHRKQAEAQGLNIQDFVEGPNTLAVFVRGPEDVSVEYIEHKPTFSLT